MPLSNWLRAIRRIPPLAWWSSEVGPLSPEARLVSLYVLAGPQTNRIGIFRFSAAAAADDLGMTVEQFARLLGVVCAAHGWRYDLTWQVIYLPNWWQFNKAQGVSVIKGWLKDLHLVPPSGLVTEFMANTKYLPRIAAANLLPPEDYSMPPRDRKCRLFREPQGG